MEEEWEEKREREEKGEEKGREGEGKGGEGRTTLHTPCRKFLATPLLHFTAVVSYLAVG